MSITVETGDVISFQLVAGNIIKDSFTGVKVLAPTMSFEFAKQFDNELANKHYNLYPFFKDKVGNVSDPSNYNYMSVQLQNGQMRVIGLPWIIDSSLTTTGNRTALITITGFQEKYRSPLIDFLGNLGASYTLNVTD